MAKKIKVGIIGFGRMGEFYLDAMKGNEEWEVTHICDISNISRDYAAAMCPAAKTVSDCDEIFSDRDVDVVVLSALADSRKELIGKAIAAGKNIIAEKGNN